MNTPQTIDDLNDISLPMIEKMVEDGLIKDCQDTDDSTEFDIQDIINEKLAEVFGLDYEKLQE